MSKELLKREIHGAVRISRAESESQEEEKTPSRTIRGRAIILGEMTDIYSEEGFVLREMIAPEAVPESLLKSSDIKMTLYHNPERILARSKKGEGTLKWERDDKGVSFEFDAPETADGDTALELVRKGVVDGCSFWAYADPDAIIVERKKEGETVIVERTVKSFIKIEDFTLTPSPAYEQTTVEADVKRAKEFAGLGKPDTGKEEFEDSWREIEEAAETNIWN